MVWSREGDGDVGDFGAEAGFAKDDLVVAGAEIAVDAAAGAGVCFEGLCGGVNEFDLNVAECRVALVAHVADEPHGIVPGVGSVLVVVCVCRFISGG